MFILGSCYIGGVIIVYVNHLTLQSIGSDPIFIKNSLAFEKCLQPRNPPLALAGDGCAASSTRCCLFLMYIFLLFAKLPHNINTTGCPTSLITLMVSSVNSSHPASL